MSFSLFNDNWYEYIKDDDTVHMTAVVNSTVNFFNSLKSTLIIMVLLAMFGVAIMLDMREPGATIGMNAWWNILLPVFLTIALVVAAVKFMRNDSARYIVTNSGVYAIYGLLKKNVKYVPYKKITDVQVSRSLVEQIVGTGSVGVSTASGGNIVNGKHLNELTIMGVADYKKIKEFIFKKIK